LEKREIKYSSKKRFKGSKPAEFYGENHFLRAEGSNYSRAGAIPCDEEYLDRNRSVVGKLLQQFPRVRTAIVLGCARGYMVQALREEMVDAVGVDISEWAIRNCSPPVADYVYCGDVCDLSRWPDGSFDVAIAFDIFEHIKVPDLYKALDEAARVAGLVLLDVPLGRDDSKPDHSGGTDASHVSCYTKAWWMRQFLRRGMEPFYSQEYAYPEGDHGATIYFKPAPPTPTAENVVLPAVKPDGKDFKILWWSNAPFTPTGYGVGTKGVVYPLNRLYDVRCIGYWGLQGAALGFNGLIVYPKLFGRFGEDAAVLVVKNWRPDVMVTLFDVWISQSASQLGEPGWLGRIHPRWIPVVPVDHDPVPPNVVESVRPAYKVVAMSQFGRRQLQMKGVESTYIPHGVDTGVFKPTADRAGDIAFLERSSMPFSEDPLPWDEDCFVLGMNAANKDQQRKGFSRMFEAAGIFLENNPDAKKDLRIYLHSWYRFPNGKNLDGVAHAFGLGDRTRCTHRYHMWCGLKPEEMARVYGGFDVLYNASMAEGFGIPIVEAAACGVPAIATDWTSMPELVGGHGWLVKPVTRKMTMLESFWAVPDVYEAADAIEDAYNHPKKVRRLGEKARKFSLDYDWKRVVVPLWVRLMEGVRGEMTAKPLEERRII